MSITKAESELRTRVISFEEEPLEEFIEDQQHFLPETLGQTSLLREMTDAIEALSKVSESHQQMHDLNFQGQESSDQMRQDGNNQHSITKEKILHYEVLVRNDGPGKRILETDQSTFQQNTLLKGQNYVQGDVPEMEKTSIFEPRVDLKPLVPIQREMPSSVEGILPPCIPIKTVLPRLHIESGPKISLVQNSKLENMSQGETRIQTSEERENLLAEDRKEGLADMSECEKNQEAGTEVNKETNVKSDNQDFQVNAGTKESSKGTTDICPYPEHLYNVLFVGDSNVGKTSFLCRLYDDSFGSNTTATIGKCLSYFAG